MCLRTSATCLFGLSLSLCITGVVNVSSIFLPWSLCVTLHDFFVCHLSALASLYNMQILCDGYAICSCVYGWCCVFLLLIVRFVCLFVAKYAIIALKFKNSFVFVCHIENNAYLCIVVKRKMFHLLKFTTMVLGLIFSVVLTFSVARICVEAKGLKNNY